MFKKNKLAAIAMLVLIILATVPAMFLAQGQVKVDPAEQTIALTERAAQQFQNLIDMIDANETAFGQIEAAGLAANYEANVTLYETEGLSNLASAQDALAASDYEAAVSYAFDALKVFREVYSSINIILEAADLQKGHLIESQGLLEAITRELQRIDRLKEVLPNSTPQEIFDLLDNAETSLAEAKTLLLDGEITAAKSAFLDAEQSLSGVYSYLKVQAEESNIWRLRVYCEGLQERIRERFRYGREQGIDFTSILQSYGYQNETQFLDALQNLTQTAQGEQSFYSALQDCQGAGQMVQQMEQALNQEINRHQGQFGPGGSSSVTDSVSGTGIDPGYGGSGSGYGGSGSGYGGSGSGGP
jgi:tetratricopeptide (TPR) repeat protein